jgi:hypothetical protein
MFPKKAAGLTLLTPFKILQNKEKIWHAEKPSKLTWLLF